MTPRISIKGGGWGPYAGRYSEKQHGDDPGDYRIVSTGKQAFSTIVSAIEQGRVIFGNIRRFIYYLLSCNVSEVLIVGLATLFGAPLPLLPLQILFLNLVTVVFPALALGMGEAEEGVMQQSSCLYSARCCRFKSNGPVIYRMDCYIRNESYTFDIGAVAENYFARVSVRKN